MKRAKKEETATEEPIKKEFVNKEIISEFINIALASSKLKKIIIHQKEGSFSGSFPNLNLLIYGEIGSTKSLLLNEICDKTKSPEPETDVSFPSLVGTVDKQTRQIQKGFCWECRNSLMLLDEFDFGKRKKEDIRALLQLSEGGKYGRRLGVFANPMNIEEEDLHYKFSDGAFRIKTRFSLILGTMKYPYTSQSQEFQALVSRSIAIPLFPDLNTLRKITDGDGIFKFKEIKIKNPIVEISKSDWNTIRDYVFKDGDKFNVLRVCGNCAKVYAVLGVHRFDLYDLIIKWGKKRFYSPKPKKEEKKK